MCVDIRGTMLYSFRSLSQSPRSRHGSQRFSRLAQRSVRQSDESCFHPEHVFIERPTYEFQGTFDKFHNNALSLLATALLYE